MIILDLDLQMTIALCIQDLPQPVISSKPMLLSALIQFKVHKFYRYIVVKP